MERIILHSDINSFYANVECLYHPEIRDFPVAVGGNPEKRHGIILAKNQKAKVAGVKPAALCGRPGRNVLSFYQVPPNYQSDGVFRLARSTYNRYSWIRWSPWSR